jgi:ABC-type glycerol-3-phosphate transport system substrate-binding protein
MGPHKRIKSLAVAIALLAVACSPSPESVTLVNPTSSPPVNAGIETSIPSTEIPGTGMTLSVWVPLEFDPYSGTPAGDLLKARLDQFSVENPEIRILIRVKAEDGPGGLLPSLTAASAAAPLALPDLVALPQHDLETAAIKNLVHPIGEMSDLLESEDWYDYALQLVRVQESEFGFAFAGDALVLLYRPADASNPPATLEAALESGWVLAFPAADEDSLFTLNLYLAHGGRIEGEEGRPFIDPAILEETLNFYRDGLETGVTPFWLTQFEEFIQARESFDEGRSQMTVEWVSNYLADPEAEIAAAGLPIPGDVGVTLATGWAWALTSRDPERLEASVKLAEYLVDPEFLGEWYAEAHVLPTRPSALEEWPRSPARDLVAAVASSARAVPSDSLLAILGPALQDATTKVLKELADPATAAQEASDALGTP